MAELQAEENLLRQGFQPFNPKIKEQKVQRGAIVTRVKPFIPGYIFVRFDPQEDRWRSINGTRGVKKLFCSDPETPSRVRDGVMQLILDQCDGDYVRQAGVDEILSRLLPVGSQVVFTEGPFEGYRGKVLLSHVQRLDVILTIFGRPQRVKKVARSSVELVH